MGAALKINLNQLAILVLALFIGLSLYQADSAGAEDVQLLGLTLLGVLSGCAALAWLRPQRVGLSPPNVMLSLGIGGMLLGLIWDTTRTPIALLNSL